MRRFLNKLFRDFRTTSTARGGRGAPRRAALQVEGLEDRLVMTSVTQSGSTLLINHIAQNHTILLQSTGFSNGFRGMKVFDNGTLVDNPNDFNISSINAVQIQVAGRDSVLIDDSHGMPFATGTTVTLSGSGAGNSMKLYGTRGIDTGELYVVGGTATTISTLEVDNLTFHLTNAIGQVDDFLQIAGTLDVATSGSNVVLQPGGFATTLKGLGAGGGSTLIYQNKNTVVVNEYAANAGVTLTASAAPMEQFFTVNMWGAGDFTIIETTPSGVLTSVNALGSQQGVPLWANSGPVSIAGNQSTSVLIGNPDEGYVTAGIQANVSVNGVGSLVLQNSGNTATQENVTVTESTISGSGLFGNNAVTVSYSNVGEVSILTGQLADTYTVIGSQPGAEFTSSIVITDDSSVSFVANVYVDSGSNLALSLVNALTQDNALSAPAYLNLYIAPGGTVGQNGSGDVSVSFSNGLASYVSELGFSVVEYGYNPNTSALTSVALS
jgi:hypothetical protein